MSEKHPLIAQFEQAQADHEVNRLAYRAAQDDLKKAQARVRETCAIASETADTLGALRPGVEKLLQKLAAQEKAAQIAAEEEAAAAAEA